MAAADPYKLRRRLGRFHVSRHLREDWEAGLLLIQSKVLILECKVDWMDDSLEYVAQGDVFDIVEPGDKVPYYTLVVHQRLTMTSCLPFDVTWERAASPDDLIRYEVVPS